MPRLKGWLPPLIALMAVLISRNVKADEFMNRLAALSDQRVRTNLTDWKFHKPDVKGGEAANFDDSSWETVTPEFQWPGENTSVWFRTRYVVPAAINGLSTENAGLRLEVGADDDGVIYVNGKKGDRFHWDEGHANLADHVRSGQSFVIAVRGINGPGNGGLRFARVVYEMMGPVQPDLDRYVMEAQFIDQAISRMPSASRERLSRTLRKSEAQVDKVALENRNWMAARASLATARKTLLTLAKPMKQYDLYYVGHAHIDMNWLWPWSETLDVCHRTWDSALNLMDEFPDFGFVQSQPGAYVPIQQSYADEFARIQKAAHRGQWNPVGGMWNESDTNMPSGEGLARSLFLGQRYFKANFGRYAETGWLPDSFGHSWQLPQLMKEAGIKYFYHTRCGDGIRYSWWRSPDGSRVLKIHTDSYDEPISRDQLSRPFEMERDYGLKEALVVFGVGDHGGGPTRDMILQGEAFQKNPLLPKIHFVTADRYFDHLAKLPQVRDLPVVDGDLQYMAVGGYTTHADIKQEVRDSENNLYAAEALSSLASMIGQPYPVSAFDDAWKPTTFAQFHDIMSGTAIHSTYDWIREQLAPAFAFEKKRTNQALSALTAAADTRGMKAGERAIVVWNPLSFERTDIVRLAVPNAGRYRSVRDSLGERDPVQALDARTVTFVAKGVPGFGHKTLFLSSAPARDNARIAKDEWGAITLENPTLRVVIAKNTGLMTSLYDKKIKRELIDPVHPGNALQILGDEGDAWDIRYTGERHDLADGAEVSLLSSGPVSAVVQVKRAYDKSIFAQNVTLYSGLPRVDVPTTVDWHQHGQLLKVAFPLAMKNPAFRGSIPYGSIDRPANGQENPGQKWMDVTEMRQDAVSSAFPLNLSGVFNQSGGIRFDSQGVSYPAALMPSPGIHRFGMARIPFQMASARKSDNIACDGQTLLIPAGARGDSLYLLGAGADGMQSGSLTLVRSDRSRSIAPFALGDWVTGGVGHNEEALKLDYRIAPGNPPAPDRTSWPHLWMQQIPIPAGAPLKKIVLPRNLALHLFAITLAKSASRTPLYGLTALNDAKYGSDTNGSVFRLTLLRSTSNPDPNPDEGSQRFTYSLSPHGGDWRTAQSEREGLGLNVPLLGVLTDAHEGRVIPTMKIEPSAQLVAGALKHDEDGSGYILRLFETQGRNAAARLTFSRPVRVEETDLLERPIHQRTISVQGSVVTFPVGHDQIVTLHITGLPDAGNASRTARRSVTNAKRK